MAAIVLTGTGPGPRGTLTARAAEVIASAAVVACDPGVAPGLLALAPPGAAVLALPTGLDAAVAALEAAAAATPGPIVRLIAGDVMTSPRHAAEARLLAARGHELEIVPGLPLEHAAVAFAGVVAGEVGPLELVRLHDDGSGGGSGTVLAVHSAPDAAGAAEALLSGGYEPSAHALVVRSPGSASQAVSEATLGELAASPRSGAAGEAPGSGAPGNGAPGSGEVPEVLVLQPAGSVRLSWFEGRPLFGRRIVVTRPRAQAAGFVEWLEAQGAEPVLFPAIRMEPPPDPAPLLRAARDVRSFDWVVFTSVNGVERFWAALEATGSDSRALAGARVAAIGPATAAALADRGIRADLVPARYVAESVLEAMAAAGRLEGARVLLPRAAGAREILPERLTALGAEVMEVEAYRAVPDTGPGAELAARIHRGEIDALTFTSSSTVRHFVDAVGSDVGDTVVACIGPVTAETARQAGLDVTVVAGEHTVPGLAAALAAHFAARRSDR